MREDSKNKRRLLIEEAAYQVLARKGYAGTSMLAVARQARASNETMYSWYGDKTGLFRALITRNTQRIGGVLDDLQRSTADPLERLSILGPQLLDMLTSDHAIALNRAAAADPTDTLGPLLAQAGRDTLSPVISRTIEAARQSGQLLFDCPKAATELYLSLLIGDLQIRCVVARFPPPDADARQAKSREALRNLCHLLSPDQLPNHPGPV